MRTSTKFMIRRILVGLAILALLAWAIAAATAFSALPDTNNICMAGTDTSTQQEYERCLESNL